MLHAETFCLKLASDKGNKVSNSAKNGNSCSNPSQQKKKITHSLFRMALFLALFCFSAGKAKASWWSDGIGDFYKASFNAATGTIHIEAFAWNGAYWTGPDYALKCQTATLAFSQDGINYTDFFEFGFNFDGSQEYARIKNGYAVSHYSQIPDQHNHVMYMDLQLTNAIKNIKSIKINVHLHGAGPHASDNNVDTRSVTVTQMSVLNTPTYEFVTVQNNGIRCSTHGKSL